MAFTLTLLGTDTKYTPKPASEEHSYFGETLSFVTSNIAQDEEITVDAITRVGGGDKACVVEGPDTLGYEVGQRISRAVISILDAVMRGETNIKIIAHSRGAVEAILVAHELQRIQELFGNKMLPTLEQLTDSEDRTNRKLAKDYSTHYAMNTDKFLVSEFRALHEKLTAHASKVKSNLAKLQFDIFNIDPVPGGNSALGNIFPTLWYDKRYFIIPSNVRSYEQCVFRHENSRSFKAIIPKAESENTHVNLFDLPGHHGTGSGNIYDHDATGPMVNKLGLPEEARRKTGHVQELMILKIVDFLSQGEDPVQFKAKSAISPGLDQQLVDLIYDDSSGQVRSQEALKAQQLVEYKCINENMALYEVFKDSHYASAAPEFLTLEQGYKRLMPSFTNFEVVSDRLVHFQEYKDFFLRNVMSQVDAPYVNQDHFYQEFSATLNSLFDISERDKPVEKLFKMAEKLVRLCRHLDFDNPTKSRIETEEKIPDYLEKLKRLNQDQTYFPRVFNGLIQASINDYLAKGMSADFRQRFLSQITSTLQELKSFSVAAQTEQHPGVKLAHVLLSSIEQGVWTTFERRAEQLYIQSISIEAMLSKTPTIIGRDLLKKWNDMCEELRQKNTASNTLRGLVDCHTTNFQVLEQTDWVDLNKAINQALDISTGFTNPDNAYSSGDRPFLACIADSFDDALQSLQELNNQAENIKKAALHCRELESYISTVENEDLLKIVSDNTSSSQDRNTQLLHLKKKHKGLIDQLANYIVKNNISKADSTQLLKELSQESLKTVEQSITELSLQWAHPDIRAELQFSKTAMISLQDLNQTLQQTNQSLQSQNRSLASQLVQLKSGGLNKEKELNTIIDGQKKLLLEKATLLAQQVSTIDLLKEKKAEDERQFASGKTKLTIEVDTKAKALAQAEQQHGTQVQRIQALEAEKNVLQSEFSSQTLHFKTELKNKDSELAEVRAKLNEKSQLLNDLGVQKAELDRQLKEKEVSSIADIARKEELLQRMQKQQEALKTQLAMNDAQLKTQADTAAQAKQAMETQHAAAIQSLEAGLKMLQDQLSLKEVSQHETTTTDKLRIQELEGQHVALQQAFQRLEADNAHALEDNAVLRTEVDQKNEQLRLLNQDIDHNKQDALEDNQDKEAICFDIIEKKLLPMTQKYLQHLNEAYDSISGDPNSDEVKARRAPISSKLREVLNLERILSGASIAPDIDQPRKNQTAILGFYKCLEAADKNLKRHRDKSWQRYVANVAKVASIVLTGIIPGLIAFGIISAVGQSPKFWQSHGQRFFAQAEKDKPKDIKNNPLNPQV